LLDFSNLAHEESGSNECCNVGAQKRYRAARFESCLATQNVEYAAGAFRESVRRTAAPVVQEDHRGLSAEHVVVDSNDIQSVRA